MKNLNLEYLEIIELSDEESVNVEGGGGPTNSTSFAYDVAYTITCWWNKTFNAPIIPFPTPSYCGDGTDFMG
jgi:hypothetical protein